MLLAAFVVLLPAACYSQPIGGVYDVHPDGTPVTRLIVVHSETSAKPAANSGGDAAAAAAVVAARAAAGVLSSSFLRGSNIFELVSFAGSSSATLVAATLASEPGVLSVQVDRVLKLLSEAVPPVDDPFYPVQWHLDNVEASRAWDLIPDDDDPEVLMIVDTG